MKKRNTFRSALALLLAVLTLSGCSGQIAKGPEETQSPAAESTAAGENLQSGEMGGAQATEEVSVPGTYAPTEDRDPEAVVATVGGAELTNIKLRIYYNMEIAAFLAGEHEEVPDLTRPLDSQSCPLSDKQISWEQYFLDRAINAWHVQMALILSSQEFQPADDPYFKKRTELYEEYMDPSLPAVPIIYGDRDYFQPNELHQAYLDSLPELTEELAKNAGFASADELAKTLAGSTAEANDLCDYAWRMNYGYIYFTEKTYSITPSEEEIDEFYRAHAADYTALESAEPTVNVRHCLIYPTVCEVEEDGTVIAGDDYWNSGMYHANSALSNWAGNWLTKRNPDATFAELCHSKSKDESTRYNGGLYDHLSKGHMMPELDEWIFDPERKVGDTTAIRSKYGFHLLYIQSINDPAREAAREDLIYQLSAEAVEKMMDTYPIEVNSGKIALFGLYTDVTPDDLLYPDVAHERFPSVPVYLQQDFRDAPYGNYNVSSHGCGITTLAMISTYLADERLTPATLAGRYGSYCLEHGTNGDIFSQAPQEMGYYLERSMSNWSDVEEALDAGKIVVSLQVKGHFTSGGHYLVLEHRLEDGRIVIRDSNVYNYKKLPGHKVDCFEPSLITASNILFWIYDPKITHIGLCARCGDPENAGSMGEIFSDDDYLCEICRKALLRRNDYIALNTDIR